MTSLTAMSAHSFNITSVWLRTGQSSNILNLLRDNKHIKEPPMKGLIMVKVFQLWQQSFGYFCLGI